MSIENTALVPASDALTPDESSARQRSIELQINICIALTPFLTAAQKLSYALQVPLNSYPLVLVLMNPVGPFLANLFQRYPLWVYLSVGGLRSCIFMPTSYIVGRYGKEYVQIQRAKRRRGTDRRANWRAKAKWALNQMVRPVRDRLRALPLVQGMMAQAGRRLKTAGRWIMRNFPKFGWLFVFIRPNGWMLMAAGATRMKPWLTGVAATSGTLAWLVAVAYMGEHIPHFVLFVFSIF